MWIQVRSMDGKRCFRIDNLSKLTKIEELRKLLVEKFEAPVSKQRLFYTGKQLEDGYTLFDYNVGLNDIVQILIRQADTDPEKSLLPSKSSISSCTNSTNKEIKPSESAATSSDSVASVEKLSKYFKIGDLVDAKDPTNGAWYPAKIVDICPSSMCDEQTLPTSTTNESEKQNNDKLDDVIYSVLFDDCEDCEDTMDMSLSTVRPRARKLIKFDDVKEGDMVMVNYNMADPEEIGYWYDCEVTSKKNTRTSKELVGNISMGARDPKLDSCKIRYVEKIFAIEKNKVLAECSKNDPEPIDSMKMPQCSHCKDIPTRKCKICNCSVCGGKDEPGKQVICDDCDLAYHIWCLEPPLADVPSEEEWYCPKCKTDETEVVKAGEKLKVSKKKAKMASSNSASSRDWGKGMACVGRTKECTIVPPNHFGPVPGVEVGTMWKYRVQVSESGVHRPHVAGIHGREIDGAFSIVLSGGYEDDLDEGEEFKYTGSGGRDLSGNKRCAEQSCDQMLTRMNKALALNCNAPLNNKGAKAKNWKEGKPVRVVRNCKGRKHSKYCPEEGNRYDGIYKVVEYWPEKGKSGYLVWRYLLRRDDLNPAPWTKAGKKRIQDLGLTMQYPEGYLESVAEKEKGVKEEKKSKNKTESSTDNASRKKRKSVYTLPTEVQKLIEKDSANKKLWTECLTGVAEGSQNFLKKVEDSFLCICCQELVHRPITTICSHNICQSCLERSFRAEVYNCPMCRQELQEEAVKNPNKMLQKILLLLFPGYDAAR